MISASDDTRKAGLALEDIRRRRIPFAAALALTRIAQEAQAEIREQLPRRFAQRGSALSYIARSVRIEPARKADANPKAAVAMPGSCASRRRAACSDL